MPLEYPLPSAVAFGASLRCVVANELLNVFELMIADYTYLNLNVFLLARN